MTNATNNENRRKDDVRPAGELEWNEGAREWDVRPGPLGDVMIDIETAGTTPGSAILSIGAVTFGLAGLGEEFYAPISLASCTAAGLTIDPATIAWWMKQSDAARAAAFRDDAEALAVVLFRFTRWYNERDAEYPWCHGATFDVPLLDAAYKACGMTPPWKFSNVRDTRTLYDLADVRVDRARGTHHNALDDARAQAEAAVVALLRLNEARSSTLQAAPALPELVQADVLTIPSSIMSINVDPRQSDEYKRGHRDARHAAADLVLARADELLSLAAPSVAAPAAEQAHTDAARDVLAERRRQVEVEGWTTACDDEHAQGQMARAAACYAAINSKPVPSMWPWAPEWWKPSDDRRNLVKAGALILAEIERLDRAGGKS